MSDKIKCFVCQNAEACNKNPVKAVESRNPSWLVIPERGLYTGVAIFGAVGSGKTSVCMHPLAQQILSRQAANPQRRGPVIHFFPQNRFRSPRL